MAIVNCLRCRFWHADNGNCTAVGGVCTAVPAVHCPLLREYLDTELTPKELKRMSNILLDVGIEYNCSREYVKNWLLDARLRELAEADKDGRIVVLPCKVGDTVYFALLGRIIEKQVFSIVSFSNSTRIYCGGTSEYFRPEDIGKTFFLTREEAERALEAKKDE